MHSVFSILRRSVGISLVGWFSFLTTAGAAGLTPPPGIDVPAAVRVELEADCAALGREVEALHADPNKLALAFWPDVAVFHKAVDWALRWDGFHGTNQFTQARQLLALGQERARELRAGRTPWLSSTGLVVRGFVSRIDNSVQPYGVVVPANWRPGGTPMRLDVWLAGRDEKRTELKFIAERLRSPGDFAPTDAVVVHPYGRFCNAYKFAGETDVFEAVSHAEASYHTDPRRRAIRGFSMGGAGTWHLAAHYPYFWKAAAPGAGFVDTARYTGVMSIQPQPPAWEQRLWRLYDVPGYALNFGQLDVLAYSGELDKQKLAADTMAEAMRAEGLELAHVIGPGVEHRYEPGAKRELAQRFDALMAQPKEPAPDSIAFTTFTARYPDHGSAAWFAVEGLVTHWEPARVRARVTDAATLSVQVTNVSAFRLKRPPGLTADRAEVVINDQVVTLRDGFRGRAGEGTLLVLRDGRWRRAESLPAVRKRPGLQGPIDDAFMERFLVVRPTGKAWNPVVDVWTRHAVERFAADWRGQFRGDILFKDDTAVTPEDIATCHLILWGDPGSNRLIRRVLGRLPIRWTRDRLEVGSQRWAARGHLPVLIQPNPLNPQHYIVLNTGHTFAGWNGTNARQTPWLPDWAVLDVSAPTGGNEVLAAGFFDERWR